MTIPSPVMLAIILFTASIIIVFVMYQVAKFDIDIFDSHDEYEESDEFNEWDEKND